MRRTFATLSVLVWGLSTLGLGEAAMIGWGCDLSCGATDSQGNCLPGDKTQTLDYSSAPYVQLIKQVGDVDPYHQASTALVNDILLAQAHVGYALFGTGSAHGAWWRSGVTVKVNVGDVIYVRAYNVPKYSVASTPLDELEVGINDVACNFSGRVVRQTMNPENYYFNSLRTERVEMGPEAAEVEIVPEAGAVQPCVVLPGQEFVMNVNVRMPNGSSASALGCYDFEISCDPAVAVIKAIEEGSAAEFDAGPVLVTNSATFQSGSTPFNDVNQTSLTTPTGLVNVAKITFVAQDVTGASTTLQINVKGLYDTNGNALPSLKKAIVVQVGYCLGDVTKDDNVVDEGDAFLIRQVLAALKDETDESFAAPPGGFDNGDINDDGQTDIADAMLILQSIVGLRPKYPCMPGYTEKCPECIPAAVLTLGAVQPTVSIGSPIVSQIPGSMFTVPVFVNSGDAALGSYLLELSYDSTVVVVRAFHPGTTAEFSSEVPLANPETFGTGTTIFVGQQVSSLTSPTGLICVAEVAFDVLADAAGRSSDLQLNAIRLKDTDAHNLLPAPVTKGHVEVSPDVDADGIADSWELMIVAFDPTLQGIEDVGPDDDYDGDGASNWKEYQSWTDPLDPDSVLAIADLYESQGVTTLEWDCVANRQYRVLVSEDLMSWTILSEGLTAQQGGSTGLWQDAESPGRRAGYYKVEVMP